MSPCREKLLVASRHWEANALRQALRLLRESHARALRARAPLLLECSWARLLLRLNAAAAAEQLAAAAARLSRGAALARAFDGWRRRGLAVRRAAEMSEYAQVWRGRALLLGGLHAL